jgi:chromosome segregation ATPase
MIVVIGMSIILNAYLFTINFQIQSHNNDLIREREALKAEVATVVTERDEALQNLEPYIGINNALSAEIEAIQQERENLKAEIDGLVTERDEATQENIQLNTELNSKLDELERLSASCVMAVGITAEDFRNSNPNSLEVSGYLINAGVNTVYNANIKVVAYDALGNLVINTTGLKNGYYIQARNYRQFIAVINYDGEPISSWTATPEWTETP